MGAHSSSSTLSLDQIAAGTSAVLEIQEGVWYDEELEQSWCRFEDHLGRSFTVGVLAVEVPQNQFFDVMLVGQVQFLDKVIGEPGVVHRQLSMLEGCSTLTSC